MTCVGVLLGPSGRCGLGISFGVKSSEEVAVGPAFLTWDMYLILSHLWL